MCIARVTGLGRAGLYKALSPEGNPEFVTVTKVLKALGLRLSVLLPGRIGGERQKCRGNRLIGHVFCLFSWFRDGLAPSPHPVKQEPGHPGHKSC